MIQEKLKEHATLIQRYIHNENPYIDHLLINEIEKETHELSKEFKKSRKISRIEWPLNNAKHEAGNDIEKICKHIIGKYGLKRGIKMIKRYMKVIQMGKN